MPQSFLNETPDDPFVCSTEWDSDADRMAYADLLETRVKDRSADCEQRDGKQVSWNPTTPS